MANDRIEILRRIYTAVQQQDADAVSRSVAHNIEWVLPETLPWGGTHQGQLGIMAVLEMHDDLMRKGNGPTPKSISRPTTATSCSAGRGVWPTRPVSPSRFRSHLLADDPWPTVSVSRVLRHRSNHEGAPRGDRGRRVIVFQRGRGNDSNPAGSRAPRHGRRDFPGCVPIVRVTPRDGSRLRRGCPAASAAADGRRRRRPRHRRAWCSSGATGRASSRRRQRRPPSDAPSGCPSLAR